MFGSVVNWCLLVLGVSERGDSCLGPGGLVGLGSKLTCLACDVYAEAACASLGSRMSSPDFIAVITDNRFRNSYDIYFEF